MRRSLYQICHSYRIIDYLTQSSNKLFNRTDSFDLLHLSKIILALSAFDVLKHCSGDCLSCSTHRPYRAGSPDQPEAKCASGTQTMGELSR